MQSKFRHVALIGKYQAVSSGDLGAASRAAMQSIAQFLHAQGCEVVFERQTAANMGIPGYDALDVAAIGAQCDLGLVVGGVLGIVVGMTSLLRGAMRMNREFDAAGRPEDKKDA